MIAWLSQPVVLWHWLIQLPLFFVLGLSLGLWRNTRTQLERYVRLLDSVADEADQTVDILKLMSERILKIEAAVCPPAIDGDAA